MLIDFDKIVRSYGKPKGILHVGANRGQEAKFYNKHGINNVVWVEALGHVYSDLVSNVAKYGHACINACVSDTEGQKVTFHESNNEAQSSSFLNLGTHKQAHPDVHYVKDYEMITTTIESLYKSHNLSGLDMVVMDIQGAEMLALKGMGDLIKDFKFAYLEVNTGYVYEGCALLPEIEKYLFKYGFKKAEQKLFAHWKWGDALFIK